MSTADFPVQRRNHGDDGFAMVAVIKCCKCFRETTCSMSGSNPGWAFRSFKSKGWLVARTRTGDVCPTCRNQKPRMAGEITPARRRAAYLAIEDRRLKREASAKEEMMGSAMKTVPSNFEPVRGPMAEALAPLLDRMTDPGAAPQEEPMMTTETASPTATPPPGAWVGTYATADSAAASAGYQLRRLGVVEGRARRDHDFEVGKLPDGAWAWRQKIGERPDGAEFVQSIRAPFPKTPPAARGMGQNLSQETSYATANGARRAAVTLLDRVGVKNATEGVHYVIEDREKGYGFKLNGAPVAPPQTSGEAVAEASRSWMDREAALGLPPSPPREMSREDRRRIRDHLDAAYDVDRQRYRSAESDAGVAKDLDVPRAWVERVRIDDYGDFDRNEAAERQVADLDKAIVDAKAAIETLLDSATKAETVLQGLEALRRKLGAS